MALVGAKLPGSRDMMKPTASVFTVFLMAGQERLLPESSSFRWPLARLIRIHAAHTLHRYHRSYLLAVQVVLSKHQGFASPVSI